MANYHTLTVVQQTIPTGDMTTLERLLLSEIFDAEQDGPVKGEPAAVRERRAGLPLFHTLQEFIHDPFCIPVAAACRSASF